MTDSHSAQIRQALHAAISERVALAPQLAQRQDSTNAQLRDLILACGRAGFHFAKGYLLAKFPDIPKEREPSAAIVAMLQQPTLELPPSLALLAARTLANRLGLYDAADLVRNLMAHAKDLDAVDAQLAASTATA